MSRILSIDDDMLVLQEVSTLLTSVGHELDLASTGREALARVMSERYDLIMLDRLLPDLDGLSILSSIRQVGITTPVLMMSALSDVRERVNGLRAGSDDYLSKPFSNEELSARVEVLLRRTHRSESAETRLNTGHLEFDLIKRRVTCKGRTIELQPTEQRMLEYMMRHAGHVQTRLMIFEGVWGYRFDPGTNVIDVHMSRLRAKLAAIDAIPTVKTVRGAGYILAE